MRPALYASTTRSKSYTLKAVIGKSGGGRKSGTGSEREATSGDKGARVESNRHMGEREASGDEGARVKSESNRHKGEHFENR